MRGIDRRTFLGAAVAAFPLALMTAKTEDGWSAEIVIPSRTLSFTRGLDQWGMKYSDS